MSKSYTVTSKGDYADVRGNLNAYRKDHGDLLAILLFKKCKHALDDFEVSAGKFVCRHCERQEP